MSKMVLTSSWILVVIVTHMREVYTICQPPWEKYVSRRPYLSCRKIFNCLPGHEILSCEKNCEPERCVPCTEGKVQPNLIHSDSNTSSLSCFYPEPNQCRSRDLVPTRTGKKISTCSLARYCRCDHTNCFYGNDPCLCGKRWKECDVNHTLDEKGHCVPCEVGFHKPFKGCGSCFKIDPYNRSTDSTDPKLHLNSTIRPDPTTSQDPSSKASRRSSIRPTSQPKVGASSRVVLDKDTTAIFSFTSEIQSSTSRGSLKPVSDAASNTTVYIIIVTALLLAIIMIIVVYLILYKRGHLYGIKDKLCSSCFTEDVDTKPTPEIQVNGQLLDTIPETIGEKQEDISERHTVETAVPLLPSTDIDTCTDGETSSRVTIAHMDLATGKSSLESQSSGISSQSATVSVSTPVPDTGPSPELHPLEVYRSISSETNPFRTEIVLSKLSTCTDDVSQSVIPQSPSDSFLHITDRGTTTTVPPNSFSSTCPSPIASDSIQTVDTDDHRISAVVLEMSSLEDPKVAEESFVTNSLCSDNADNTHNMCSLRPSENEDETLSKEEDKKYIYTGEGSKDGHYIPCSTNSGSMQLNSTSCKETQGVLHGDKDNA